MMTPRSILACLLSLWAGSALSQAYVPALDASEAYPGGATTAPIETGDTAFTRPSSNLRAEIELDFLVGRDLFTREWTPLGAGDSATDGLGPLFNAASCEGCHVRDGRGPAALPSGEVPAPVVLKVSLAEGVDHPVYGRQFQTEAIEGYLAEARLDVKWEEIVVPLSGGDSARLRKPVFKVRDPAYGALASDILLSARVAQPMIGVGLLEAIPDASIVSGADPEDTDGDGVSGRVHWVESVETGARMIGRFGWKAAVPSLKEQTAGALSRDMGLSTTLFLDPSGECTEAQTACRSLSSSNVPEVSDAALDLLTLYSRNIAPPARRDVDAPEVLLGRSVFHDVGCAACHRPSFVTDTLSSLPEQSGQRIWPYTDMLLHDMGPGLADGRPEGDASGAEWRTAPLWGVGLAQVVNPEAGFLHDGRARTLLEAVLWHGGEAQAARDAVVALPPSDRSALIQFLESL